MRRVSWPIRALALLLLAPLLVVVTAPLHSTATEWSFVAHELLPSHLRETGLLLVISVVLAVIFGTGAAWLVSAFRFPGRDLFRWALVLPLALPTYISAITFAALLGPTGSIRLALGLPFDIVNLPGLALVFALVLFPYVYLPARAAFSTSMAVHLDAARMLGGSAVRRFFRVAAPLARPAIAGGAFLVAMETLNDYGAVNYYGIHTLTAGIFRAWGGLYDVGSALRLSGLLLALVLVLVWSEGRIRQRALHSTAHHATERIALDGWRRVAASAACGLLLFAGFVLPVAAILMDAFRTADLSHLRIVLPALGNTLLVGAIAAALTLSVAIVLAYSERHERSRSRLVQWAGLGYAVPGAVIALGVMALAGWIGDQTGIVLIGGIGLLAYAFTVRFLALAGQPLRAGLAQQQRSLDESARLLGASPVRTFFSVNMPLLRPALIAAALLVLMEVVKELPLTIILRPFDFDTLSTRVYELARIEQWADAAVPALLIVLCGLVPVLLLDRLSQRARG
jgi:iron(III) transport system permease protein